MLRKCQVAHISNLKLPFTAIFMKSDLRVMGLWVKLSPIRSTTNIAPNNALTVHVSGHRPQIHVFYA